MRAAHQPFCWSPPDARRWRPLFLQASLKSVPEHRTDLQLKDAEPSNSSNGLDYINPDQPQRSAIARNRDMMQFDNTARKNRLRQAGSDPTSTEWLMRRDSFEWYPLLAKNKI